MPSPPLKKYLQAPSLCRGPQDRRRPPLSSIRARCASRVPSRSPAGGTAGRLAFPLGLKPTGPQRAELLRVPLSPPRSLRLPTHPLGRAAGSRFGHLGSGIEGPSPCLHWGTSGHPASQDKPSCAAGVVSHTAYLGGPEPTAEGPRHPQRRRAPLSQHPQGPGSSPPSGCPLPWAPGSADSQRTLTAPRPRPPSRTLPLPWEGADLLPCT